MGMWEEASDTGMKGKKKKKDKNEEEEEERGKKERMVNLTLEMIYLLTGEHYIPRKKSDDGGALHAPGSVIQKENNKNDKKILELMSNIIQLLTGEVAIRTHHVSIYFSLDEWDYIKGNKDLYEEEMKEEPQQLHPLDGEYEDKRDIPSDLGGTLCSNNEPSKIGAEGAEFYGDGNLTNLEMSPAEQPPPANGIKEEEISWEGGNQSDCSINPVTEQIQGTDTPTPIMGCRMNNSSACNIKEEVDSWEGRDQSDCSINPLKEQGTDKATPIMGCSLAANYKSDNIEEEAASCEEEHLSDYRIITVSEPEQETDTASVIMGCSSNNFLSPNYISVIIAEEPVRWEEGNQSDCSINPLTEQIQGTHTTTPIMGSDFSNRVSQGYCHAQDLCRNSDLSNHEGTLNTEEKVFSCPSCQKYFKSESDLIDHQKLHAGEKPFSCFICGKSFSRRSVLAVHQRTHTGEKPHACSECGKTFAHQSDLNRHQKSHTGYKPFSCLDCGKCFTRRWYLNVHRKIHTKEKQFTCSECGKGFTQLSNLNVHYRIHTGEQQYICSACGQCFQNCLALIEHQRSHTGQTAFLP